MRLGALGKNDPCATSAGRRVLTLQAHLKQVPEDARARIQLAIDYAQSDRLDDAVREANLAIR